MGLLFDASSSQYLVASNAFITDYPFSVGMWVNLAAVGASARTLWCLSDTGTTNNFFEIAMDSSEQITLAASAGGAAATATAVIAIPANEWTFILGRFISSTLRRLHVYYFGAAAVITSDGNTTSRAPTGIDTVTIGAQNTSSGLSQYWDGLIAEYWLAASDVRATNGVIATTEFIKLAFGGPLTMPYISVVEHLSFRKGWPAVDGGDKITMGAGVHNWVATNGPILSTHPPLPYWYRRPNQTIRNLMV